MKRYELTYLTPIGLSEEEQKNLSLKVASYVDATAENKQENSLWVSFDFNAEPEKLEEIKAKLKEEPLIKKYMLVKKEIIKPSSMFFKRRKPIKTDGIGDKTIIQSDKPKEKINLQEIEKKLDEILKET